jgi:hypothetical protein
VRVFLGLQLKKMAAERVKDVGILAMDIYFPPNCVLQVQHHTIAHSLSLSLSLSGLIFIASPHISLLLETRLDSRGSECSPFSLVPAVIKKHTRI